MQEIRINNHFSPWSWSWSLRRKHSNSPSRTFTRRAYESEMTWYLLRLRIAHGYKNKNAMILCSWGTEIIWTCAHVPLSISFQFPISSWLILYSQRTYIKRINFVNAKIFIYFQSFVYPYRAPYLLHTHKPQSTTTTAYSQCFTFHLQFILTSER
jgi:hypothetical protein